MADHIVGPIEAPAHVTLGDGLELPVGREAAYPARAALAYDDAPFQIEGRAVTFLGLRHELRLLAGRDPVQPIHAQIDEVIETVRMPQRALGKREARGESLRIGRFQYFGNVFVAHASLLIRRKRWKPGSPLSTVVVLVSHLLRGS